MALRKVTAYHDVKEDVVAYDEFSEVARFGNMLCSGLAGAGAALSRLPLHERRSVAVHRRTAQLVVERLLAVAAHCVNNVPRQQPLARARSKRDEVLCEPVSGGMGHSMLPAAKQRLRCEGCLLQVGVRTLGAFLATPCAKGSGKPRATDATRDDDGAVYQEAEGTCPRGAAATL